MLRIALVLAGLRARMRASLRGIRRPGTAKDGRCFSLTLMARNGSFKPLAA
jgi:hypothetical protein